MNIKEYRRQIEQDVARAEASAAEPRWNAAVESAGGLERLGLASGEDVSERLEAVLADRSNPSSLRCAALGELVDRHSDSETEHEIALDRLADPDESPDVRLAALKILQVETFSSPTAADWRPAYAEALRSATRADDERLRYSAFAALTAMNDRTSQEALMRGLAEPESARLPPEQALQLLGQDPHSGVQEMAQELADDRSNEDARLEALRVLANDPGSVPRFRSLFLDGEEGPEVRKLAATALYSLDRDSLREIVEGMERPRSGRRGLAPEKMSVSDQHAILHAEALLK